MLRFHSQSSETMNAFLFLLCRYSRRDPYEGENAADVLMQVTDRNVMKRPPVPRTMPTQITAIMTDCVEDDANKRPSFEELDTRLKRVDAENVDPGQTVKARDAAISLFDIFPRHIAEALRDGRTVEPEQREIVTIFFSDIVGFTSMSAEMAPRKVADMLDRLYTQFDSLSAKHDIFKVSICFMRIDEGCCCSWGMVNLNSNETRCCLNLRCTVVFPHFFFAANTSTRTLLSWQVETIGDAYMAVTNLVKDQQQDHAKRIAAFAIDAIKAANETLIDTDDESRGFVNIRVGFHSGSVVADVVGTRNPRYCLFGDSVNTAR